MVFSRWLYSDKCNTPCDWCASWNLVAFDSELRQQSQIAWSKMASFIFLWSNSKPLVVFRFGRNGSAKQITCCNGCAFLKQFQIMTFVQNYPRDTMIDFKNWRIKVFNENETNLLLQQSDNVSVLALLMWMVAIAAGGGLVWRRTNAKEVAWSMGMNWRTLSKNEFHCTLHVFLVVEVSTFLPNVQVRSVVNGRVHLLQGLSGWWSWKLVEMKCMRHFHHVYGGLLVTCHTCQHTHKNSEMERLICWLLNHNRHLPVHAARLKLTVSFWNQILLEQKLIWRHDVRCNLRRLECFESKRMDFQCNRCYSRWHPWHLIPPQ